MPSDPRVEQVLGLVAGAQARVRASVATAADQVGDYLDSHREPASAGQEVSARLGRFAAGRVNESRFTSLFEPDTVAPGGLEPMERAAAVLAEVLAQDNASIQTLPCGGNLGRLVEDLLARTGRAFGAALLFQAARSGAYRPDQHDRLLEGLPFARWNRSERQLAPPLVVLLDGADARAEGLAPFLDGGVKVVLLLDPPVPPAPLVRLITPGVFVMQTAEEADLTRFMAFDGPGVAALVPETAARFIHDPAGGAMLAQRLTIQHLPTEPPRAAVGGCSAWQQREELTQLALLADLAAAQPSPVRGNAATAGEQSVDALASWLLAQAGLAPAAGAPAT